LPYSKCPKQFGRVIEPKCCKYNRTIIQPLKNKITFKEQVMKIVKEEKTITYDEEHTNNFEQIHTHNEDDRKKTS